MIEPRVYRAAFVPAVLAAVLVMFSIESRPRPLPQGLPADVLFDGRQAAAATRQIAETNPDRRAGRPGDAAIADRVARTFRSRGFSVELDRFERDGKRLVNVVGRRAGKSRRQIVVVAARDATGVPDAAGSAGDTAALMELARVFEGRPSRRTLVLASVDGSALGEVGVRRLVDGLESSELVEGVLVISNLAARSTGRPTVVTWSNDVTRGGIGLQRTVSDSIRQELSAPAAGASFAGQLARLAFPIGIGGQGVLLDEGYEGARIAGDGEVADTAGSGPEDVDEDRLGGLGRATLRTVTALDQGGRPEHGPRTYLTAVSQVLPGWVLRLLALTLILPALVATVDAFARMRRRRVPVGPWLSWLGAGVLAFVAGLGLSYALALAGATPDPPAAPVAPDLYPLDGPALAVLGVVAVFTTLAWLALRSVAVRTDPALTDPANAGAGVAVALTLTLAALALWAVNPFSALVVAPGIHLWILATLVDPPPSRRARLIMVACGFVLPVLVAAYAMAVLGLDPLSGAWYLFLLVTGGHVSVVSALLGCVVAAALLSVVVIARSPHPEVEGKPEGPSVRGPGSYAGPGSLGGTESALRR